eukprot:202149_1
MSTITIGDTVTLKNDHLIGVVRFVGHIENKTDIFYGIELKKAKGKNNGTINNITYFKCKPNSGIFVKSTGITNIISTNIAKRVTVGSNIQCIKENCTGIIRYIGPFKKLDICYGIELQKPNGKHNGMINNRKYFKCKDKHGIFLESTGFKIITNHSTLQVKNTLNIQKRLSSKQNSKLQIMDKITVGDTVKLKKDNLTGIVRFIGEIKNKNDIFYGIELYQKKGKNNGCIDGITYFKCNFNHGIFVRRTAIIKTKTIENVPRVTVGDNVKCFKIKCNGTIKFIGMIPFHKNIIYYGIELMNPNGKNNGIINNRQYFKCKDKYGIFLEGHEFIPLKNISTKSNISQQRFKIIPKKKSLNTKQKEDNSELNRLKKLLTEKNSLYQNLEKQLNEQQNTNDILIKKMKKMEHKQEYINTKNEMTD